MVTAVGKTTDTIKGICKRAALRGKDVEKVKRTINFETKPVVNIKQIHELLMFSNNLLYCYCMINRLYDQPLLFSFVM